MTTRRVNIAITLGAAAVVATSATALAAGVDEAGATQALNPPTAPSTHTAKAGNPNVLQSCVPYFGLGKDVSNLVEFKVDTTGLVSSDPVVGDNVTAIVSATDASNVTVTCQLDAASLAWTNASDFFSSYLNGLDPVIGPYTYPGRATFYETPALGISYTIGGNQFTPTSVKLSFTTSIKGVTISSPHANLEDLEHGYLAGFGDPPVNDPGVIGSSDRMLNAGATRGAATMLTDLQTTGVCSADAAAIASFNAHIAVLSSSASVPSMYDCSSNIPTFEAQDVYLSSLFMEKVKYANFNLIVAGADVPTTSPATTLAPTTIAPATTEAAALSMTGASIGLTGGLGALLVGLGCTVRRGARRLRRR